MPITKLTAINKTNKVKNASLNKSDKIVVKKWIAITLRVVLILFLIETAVFFVLFKNDFFNKIGEGLTIQNFTKKQSVAVKTFPGKDTLLDCLQRIDDINPPSNDRSVSPCFDDWLSGDNLSWYASLRDQLIAENKTYCNVLSKKYINEDLGFEMDVPAYVNIQHDRFRDYVSRRSVVCGVEGFDFNFSSEILSDDTFKSNCWSDKDGREFTTTSSCKVNLKFLGYTKDKEGKIYSVSDPYSAPRGESVDKMVVSYAKGMLIFTTQTGEESMNPADMEFIKTISFK